MGKTISRRTRRPDRRVLGGDRIFISNGTTPPGDDVLLDYVIPKGKPLEFTDKRMQVVVARNGRVMSYTPSSI